MQIQETAKVTAGATKFGILIQDNTLSTTENPFNPYKDSQCVSSLPRAKETMEKLDITRSENSPCSCLQVYVAGFCAARSDSVMPAVCPVPEHPYYSSRHGFRWILSLHSDRRDTKAFEFEHSWNLQMIDIRCYLGKKLTIQLSCPSICVRFYPRRVQGLSASNMIYHDLPYRWNVYVKSCIIPILILIYL